MRRSGVSQLTATQERIAQKPAYPGEYPTSISTTMTTRGTDMNHCFFKICQAVGAPSSRMPTRP